MRKLISFPSCWFLLYICTKLLDAVNMGATIKLHFYAHFYILVVFKFAYCVGGWLLSTFVQEENFNVYFSI